TWTDLGDHAWFLVIPGSALRFASCLCRIVDCVDTEQAGELAYAIAQGFRRILVARNGGKQRAGQRGIALFEIGHADQLASAAEPGIARYREVLQAIDH